jgi:hypothetical protein
MSNLVSGRVEKTPQSGITSDRYEFLGLEQAEPDLGDPIIGPSSTGSNPFTGNISDSYVLISDSSGSGKRYWTRQANIIAGGVVNPGSITVRDEGNIIGAVNQITDINFIGTGVTVLSPASWSGAGSSSVDIQISVTDVEIPTGQTGSVAYRDANSLLQGAPNFIFNPLTGNVGVGTIFPKVKLDVLGNAIISGILTVGILSASTGTFVDSLKVGNFEISDDTTFVRIVSGSIGVGTDEPIATLDVRGTVNVSGAATISSIDSNSATIDELISDRISVGFITATNGFIGVQTSNIINVGVITANSITSNSGSLSNIVGTAATITNIFSNVLTLSNTLQFDTNTLFASSSTKRVGFGTNNPTQRIQVGTSTSPVVITDSGRIGINTTSPDFNLDVRGTVGFSSFIFVGGTSGLANQILVSGGSGLPFWGAPTNITVGSAASVSIGNTQESALFFPTFTRQAIDNAVLRVNTSGLVFNPSTNQLGIGTTNPISNLDVVGNVRTNNIQVTDNISVGVNTISNISTGILTTVSIAQTTISSLNTNTFRSARYNVQVTTTGQLVGSGSSSSSVSIGNLIGGTNYISGVYPNVALTNIFGGGSDARGTLTVSPEKDLIIDSISNGRFNSSNVSGTVLNAPISFSRAIPATPRENSKLTSLVVLNVGSGYTSPPTIQISAPTNNPVIPGVSGSGINATASVGTYVISNVSITSPGQHSTIPIVSFRSPVGVGSSAIGSSGVGISSVAIVTAGSGYNVIPSINVSSTFGDPLEPANVSISTVFLTNIYVPQTGLGYTSGNIPLITISAPNVGINTARAVVNSLGISTHFTIIPGIGYTTPPNLTVSTPNVGLNTATITSTLGISSVVITNPGTGYTASAQIQISTSPTVIGFAATVGLGVTSDNIITSGGSGYTSTPTVTFSAPQIGINTATGQFQDRISGVLSNFVILNPGSGYLTPPTVTVTGGGGSGAGVTITTMRVSNVVVNNTGFGVTVVPSISLISPVGGGVQATCSMGVGSVNVVGFGSGYNLAPQITVTSVGPSGAGASIIAGLGVTPSNITITNPGFGYSSVPTVTITSPSPVSIAATAFSGVGVTGIRINNPGIGYSGVIPNIQITTPNLGAGASVIVSRVSVSNVYISNPGSGYTAFDLNNFPIITYNPVGTSSTVGFGISTIQITNLGLGYTSAASIAVTISSPTLSTGTTATATASLGFPGILPGPGVNTTGPTRIYYVASIDANSIGISTGVGIGLLSNTDVGDDIFTVDKPVAFIGGRVSGVSINSPGSGYSTTTVLTASNFDGANVGSGFSFTSSRVVNNYQISDVLILQSVGSANTSCDFIEYGTISNNEILGSFNSDISGNNARLLFTPTYRNNTIKISTHSITN